MSLPSDESKYTLYVNDNPVMFNPPERMVAFLNGIPHIVDIHAYDPRLKAYPFVEIDGNGKPWFRQRAYIIPSEPPVKVTNLALARWLSSGNGQVQYMDEYGNEHTSTSWDYLGGDDSDCLYEKSSTDPVRVRRYGDSDFVPPTPEYLEISR